MFFNALIITVILPIQTCASNPKFEPFVVKAVIDTAVLIGLPASKTARKNAMQAQKPDFFSAEMALASKPVGWRRLYFRKEFSQ